MKAVHHSAKGGHSRVNVSIKRTKLYFYWLSLRKDIIKYIKVCEVCQRNKGKHVPAPGLLQPSLIPSQSWEIITMDFMEGLPKSKGKYTILVVIDKFTK